jgi:uncharacterized membrane protein
VISNIEEITDKVTKNMPRSTGAILYNLQEPVLVALSLGISLQFANCITIVYVIIDICALAPMILSKEFEVIKAKLIVTWVKFGLAIVSIGVKVAGCLYYDKFSTL